jgi:benzil reductase ((S)-benzoin forming)
MRLAVITGGSRGLGAALCGLYAGQGWTVVEFSRTAPYPFSVRLDLADPLTTAVAFQKGLAPSATFPLSEVLAINSAAILGPVGPVERSSPEDIARHIDVNVTSAVLFARAVVAAFQAHKCPKSLVSISSGAAARGLAGWSLYCASKAALDNYIRAVALEQAARDHPIRAFGVNPGVMDSAMQAAVRAASVEDFPTVERYARLHREGRLAQPASVAARIADLVASRPEPGSIYSL